MRALKTFGLVLIILVLALPSQTTEKFLLDRFIQEVLESNPSLQAAQSRAAAVGFRVKPSGTLDDPVFGVGPDEVPFHGEGSMIRYQLNQTFPYPGKLFTRSRAAGARAESARSDAETSRRQLIVFATQAYYKAFFNQEVLKVNTELQGFLKPLIETSKNRYVTGSPAHHEWLLGKAELSILEVNRLKLLREKTSLQALLNELRNQSPETPLGSLVVALPGRNSIKEMKAAASLEHQPELQSLDSIVQATQQEKHLARLGYIPDFMVQGMITQPQNMMDEPNRWGLMVGLNLPVFAYRKQANLVKAAQKEQEAALAERKSLENKLQTELTGAKQQFQTALDLVKLYQGSVIPETRLALSSAQSAYSGGTAPLSGVLNLMQIRLAQEQEYLASQIDLELAQLRVKELLSSPPVEQFAPSVPTLFSTEPVELMNSGAGMGRGGMSGPAAQPQKMGQTPNSSGTGGTDMGGMK